MLHHIGSLHACDALNVKSMNVGPGSKQAKLRDTIWQGHPHRLTLPDGKPKGIKLVLEKRGIDTTGWTAKEMQAVLASHEDFTNERNCGGESSRREGSHLHFHFQVPL